MNVCVVQLPSLLSAGHLHGRTVVVFDVLRATTTMSAALAAGVESIHVFDSIDKVLLARKAHRQAILVGERNCFKPDGFDLGNSPGAFNRKDHFGKILLMATTNGTRAIHAAQGAPVVLAGAIVNARAVAEKLVALKRDVTLLCAGTNGEVAPEDMIGCGAVMNEIQKLQVVKPGDEPSQTALDLFKANESQLEAALRETPGGKNVIAARLPADIEFAARLNSIRSVGELHRDPLRVMSCA